ncbi:MAG: FG-GAP-like repeat-containing protein [Sulfurovum sp.]|nr:FG-GAP-like repeat-containing protein [Sulfurovum sp.]
MKLRYISLLFFVLFFSTQLKATIVGTTKGNLAINQGRANYTINIDVPPGVASMKPVLSLDYSSSGNNGQMGIGWSIGGVSSISRCAQTKAVDGENYDPNVNYDDKDRFCLDGKRLINITGDYGAPGTEYRTEIDTYSKIVSKGDYNGGPLYFEVKTKNGLTYYYGQDNASSLLAANGSVRFWKIDKIIDSSGNEINFHYLKNETEGFHYLDKVTYADNEVNYVYETRPDILRGYQSGSPALIDKRLKEVIVTTNGQEIRRYKITYDNEVSGAKRSKVTSVTEQVSEGELATLYMSYDENIANEFSKDNITIPETVTEGVSFLDLNGDGFVDIASEDKLWINKGDGTFNPAVPLEKGDGVVMSDGEIWKLGDIPYHFRAYVDYDQDGDLDCYAIRSSENENYKVKYNDNLNVDIYVYRIYRYINDGNGGMVPDIGPNKEKSIKILQYYKPLESTDEAFKFTDFNNDGLIDIICTSWNYTDNYMDHNEYTFIYYGNKSGGYDLHQLVGPENVFMYTLFFFDINGDGLDDIYDASDYHYNKIFLNDGNGAYKSIDYSLYSAYARLRFADLNGDGLIDIYQIIKDADSGTVWLNRGDGSFIDSYSPNISASYDNLKLIDVNNDSYPDIYIIRSDGDDEIWLNNGNGDFPEPSYTVDVDAEIKQLAFADLNGDGSLEIIKTDSGHAVWSNQVKLPLLTHITNYSDQDIKITYKPMTDSNVYYSYRANGENNAYAWNSIDNDNLEVVSSRHLVSSVDMANGVGGFNTLNYKYFGYIFNKLRGSQGFHSINVYKDTTQKESKTVYKQIESPNGEGFQYTGMPHYSYSKKYRSSDSELLSENFIEYADSVFLNGVEGTQIHQPYPFKNVTNRFDPDTKLPLSKSYHFNCLDNNTHDDDSTCLDAPTPQKIDESGVGNVLMAVDRIDDIVNDQTYTKTTYNYYNSDASSAQDWIIGKVSKTNVVHQKTGSNDISKSSEFTYNTQGLLTEEIANAGTDVALTKSYTYDIYGNVATETTSGYGIQTATTTYGYSDDGKFQISVTDATGLKDEKTFDPRFGTIKTLKGPNELTTSWIYDGFGRKIQEDRADGIQTFWTYSWDDGSAIGVNHGLYSLKVESTGEPTTVTYYDMLDREVGSYSNILNKTVQRLKTYDEKGQLREETLPYYAGEAYSEVITDYDDYGRVKKVTKPGPNDTLKIYEKTYDNFASIVTDPNGNKKKTLNNAFGQTISITDAFESGKDSTVVYTYDSIGNLLTATDSAGNVIEMGYDAAGNKSYMNDPDRGIWNYRYNALGQLLQQWSGMEEPNQSRRYTYYAYDKLGRISYKKTYDRYYLIFVDNEDYSFHTTRYIYSGSTAAIGSRGKLQKAYTYSEKEFGTDFQMQTKIFTYDSLGRPIQTKNSINGRGDYYSSTAYYDSGEDLGKVQSITYPNGYEVTYHYQDGILEYAEGSDGKIHYKINKLNAFGDITEAVFANGVKTFTDYDKAGYLEDIVSGVALNAFSDVQHLNYTYDSLGNIKTRNDSYSLTGKYIKDTYAYDEMNRLTHQIINTNLIGVYAEHKDFSYDELGNITYLDAYESDDGDHIPVPGEVSGEYKYESSRPYAVTSVGSRVYQYDDVGNVVYRNGDTITYNLHNKPSTITSGSTNKTTKFYYGIDDQRFKKVFDNNLYTYYIDKSYEEQVEGYETREICYINIGGKTVGIHTEVKNTYYDPSHANYNEASYNRYFHTDALGSITAITDDNGSVVKRRSYDAFGKIRALDYGTNDNRSLLDRVIETTRAYTGHEQVAEVPGLIHMNARVYDSDIGRFLSADTIIQNPYDSQYFNRYSYVRNNPVNYTDPTGHETVDLGTIYCYAEEPEYDSSYVPTYYDDAGIGISADAYSNSYDYGFTSITGNDLESSFEYKGAASRYGWNFMGDTYNVPGYLVQSSYYIRVPDPRSVTVPASYADMIKLSQKSNSTVFTQDLKSVARSPQNQLMHYGSGVPRTSTSFMDYATDTVSSLITDYGDLAYTAFTFSNVGATYDTISQYASDEIGGVQAAAMLGAGLLFGGVGTKAVKTLYRGGKYGNLFSKRGVIERHHMPADSTTNISKHKGPTIEMDYDDHRKTSSWGSSSEAKAYQNKLQGMFFRDAMATDIRDIRNKFGRKYNGAIREMLDYSYGKGYLHK